MSVVVRKCAIAIETYGDGAGDIPATISAVMQVGSDGDPHIVELTVRAAEGGEIPAQAARDIDFEMLARALSGAVAATLHQPERTSAKTSKTPKTAKESPKPATAAVSERPYRKMPDVEEVKEVFLRTGSVGKLAHHYAVPRYTAQAWVDRLRRLGHLEETKRSV